jgi:two-component system, NarL family, response regulator LiaR
MDAVIGDSPDYMTQPDAPLRVIIADDDPLARRAVRDALQGAGLTVVAEASGGREAVELALHYRPDVVLMDVVMPDMDGLTATRRIAARLPSTRIVIFTAAGDEDTGLLGLRLGAAGFLAKDVDVAVLPRALERVCAGEAAVSRQLTMKLVESLRHVRDDGAGLRPVRSPLTAREWEVLDLLAQGRGTDEIADQLVLSTETVRSHVKHVLRKLNVRSRSEAVAAAERMRRDLLRPEGEVEEDTRQGPR